MKPIIPISVARSILAAKLTDEQVLRCIQDAFADARHWFGQAVSGTLPDINTMHLDWEIPTDIREAGVDGYGMQRLSFAIANESVFGNKEGTCRLISHHA